MRNILEKIAERFSGKGIDKKFPFFVWLYKRVFTSFSSYGQTKVAIPLNSILFVSKRDSGMGLTLRTKGKFEAVQSKIFLQLVKQKDVVFDVGANVGYYTVLASKLVGPKGKVYAFEPDSENLRLLKNNLKLNDCKNVEVYPFALGSKDGQGLFLRDNSNPGESRLSDKGGKKIEIRTIDSFVKNKKIKRVNLLKIDAEGAEIDVLKGSQKFVSSQKGLKLFTEVNSHALSRFGYTPEDLKNLLINLGFTLDRVIDENSGKNLKFSHNSFTKAQKRSSFFVLFGEKGSKVKNLKPLVSVVMTTFNAETYVGEAIRSLINQTYRKMEIIVVDDGSKDQTVSIVKFYAKTDQRIKLFKLNRNLGPSKASNFGIKRSRGEFIARMDADDIAVSDRIEKQVKFLGKNPEVIAIGGQCNLINEDGRLIGQKTFPTTNSGIYGALFTINPIQHPTLMIRRNLLPKKFIFYHNHFVLSHDLELIFELTKYGRLANLRDKVLYYRKHLASLSLKDPKETFESTLSVRMKATRKYGYRPSLKGWFTHLVQTAVVFLLPKSLIVPVFSIFRGLSKLNLRITPSKEVSSAFGN